METKAGEVRVAKAERRRNEARTKRAKKKRAEKTKKGKNNRGKESSKGIGDLGQRRKRSSKVRGRNKIIGTRKIL